LKSATPLGGAYSAFSENPRIDGTGRRRKRRKEERIGKENENTRRRELEERGWKIRVGACVPTYFTI